MLLARDVLQDGIYFVIDITRLVNRTLGPIDTTTTKSLERESNEIRTHVETLHLNLRLY